MVEVFSIVPYKQTVWWTKFIDAAMGEAFEFYAGAEYDIHIGGGSVTMC
jgi:hypothetical protein